MTSILHSDPDKRQLEIDDESAVDAEPYEFMEITPLAHRDDDPSLGGVTPRVTRSSTRKNPLTPISLPIGEPSKSVSVDPSTLRVANQLILLVLPKEEIHQLTRRIAG